MRTIHPNVIIGWLVGSALIVVLLSALLVVQGFARQTQVFVGDRMVLARVADTESSRTHGLSGTLSLREDQAMLFVFDHSAKWPIWMKDMNYSIDVIWIDKDKTVVGIASDLSPGSYPHSFKPSQTALYVLEVPGGFARRHAVKTGAVVDFAVPTVDNNRLEMVKLPLLKQLVSLVGQ